MRILVALSFLLLPACAAAQQPSATFGSDREKLSYALGMDLGKQLRQKNVDVDAAVFGRALADALAGNPLLLSDEESRKLVSALQEEMQRREFTRIVEEADRNKKAGDAFLAANKAKDGVVTLDSGLQYRVLKAGDGPKPGPDATVACQYRGTLLDGTEFDSSYSTPEPPTFPVNKVIKGWSEALQLMPVGSKWQIVLPPDLAYGSRGAGGKIPPNATLVFDLELVAIK